jgi:uncharacterized Ntn-hydrolase superfamily protein
MTFSIVAIDKQKRELGFAISSCSFNSGLVCQAEVETGVISSQAQGNLAFLPLFFEKLGEKKSLESILSHFKKTDKDIETRQIGMITSEGEKLAFTGKKCAFWCGHRTGEGYSCQGNILVSSKVIEHMAEAFENTKESLIERLYAALRAGDDAGGDARGKQSARLLVKKKGGGLLGSDTVVDITIEDHEEPVKEIGRILRVRKNVREGFQLCNAAGKGDPEALARLEQFLKDKENRVYIDFWATIAGIFSERKMEEKAVYYYKKVLQISPTMINLLKQNAKIWNMPREIVEAILKEHGG